MPGNVEETDLPARTAQLPCNGLRLLRRAIHQRSYVNHGNGAHVYLLRQSLNQKQYLCPKLSKTEASGGQFRGFFPCAGRSSTSLNSWKPTSARLLSRWWLRSPSRAACISFGKKKRPATELLSTFPRCPRQKTIPRVKMRSRSDHPRSCSE